MTGNRSPLFNLFLTIFAIQEHELKPSSGLLANYFPIDELGRSFAARKFPGMHGMSQVFNCQSDIASFMFRAQFDLRIMKETDSHSFSVATPETGFGRLKWVVLLFVLLAFAYHLGLAARGMGEYRGQHLGTAVEYAKGKIDLLRPRIVGFDANDVPIAQEVPLWQAATAVCFKCFGLWFGWANVVSLLFTLAGLWPMFQLAKVALGDRGAWWALIFFIAQPLVFWEGGKGGTDGSCLTFLLWFLFFEEKLVRTGEFKWWLPAIIFGALSATSKAPFFFCAGLIGFFSVLLNHRHSLRRWVLLCSVGLLVVLLFMVWTHHTNRLAAQAEFPFVDLRISTSDTKEGSTFWWFFGDLRYRLNPGVWAKAGWRFLVAAFGSFALLGLAIAGFVFLRSGLIRYWLSASLITILVFTHVILHHNNYFLMLSPAVAILCAAGILELEIGLKGAWLKLVPWIPAAMSVLLMLALIEGLSAMKVVLDSDQYPKKMARIIDEHTAPTDKILIQGGDWGGLELFLADRKGLSIWNTKIAEDPHNLNRLRELGYTKLVMLSESPLLVALQQVNPGGQNVQRNTYKEALTPVAERWPTLFQTEDILIKEIPAN
jgi:hypothetical protein